MHKDVIQEIHKLSDELAEQNIFMGGKGFYQVLDEKPDLSQKNKFFCHFMKDAKRYIIDFAPADINHIELQKYLRRALFLLILESNKKVITAHDFSIDPTRSFVVLQWLPGKTLANVLKQMQLTPKESLWLLLDLIDALEHLEDFSFVHRNIHPKNITIRSRGAVAYLGGFEYLSQTDFQETKLIDINTHYISPELMRSLLFPEKRVFINTSTDLYSIGAIFFHMLTGKHPFPAKRDLARWCRKCRVPKVVLEGTPRRERKYFQKLVKYLLHPKSDDRWGYEQIRNYIFQYLDKDERDKDMERLKKE